MVNSNDGPNFFIPLYPCPLSHVFALQHERDSLTLMPCAMTPGLAIWLVLVTVT